MRNRLNVTVDGFELVAKLKKLGEFKGLNDPSATATFALAAEILAQSLRDLSAEESHSKTMSDLASVRKTQIDELEQRLSEQNATIEEVLKVTDDMRSVGWYIGKTVTDMGQKIYDIIAHSGATEKRK